MTELLSLLAGGGLFAAGMLTGVLPRVLPRRSPAGPPALACSCSHTPGSHDDQAGQCRAQLHREHYLEDGDRNGWEYVPCPCMTYDGPEPLSAFAPRGLALPPS